MLKEKNKSRETNEKKMKAKGITLIALVITVIVLLILAGITIATLTGENGILIRAIDAKEQTQIEEEKEKIELSVVGAYAKDNEGQIKRNYLNDELTNHIGVEGLDYTLSEFAPFIVTYLDSERSYLIDEDGNVSEYVDIAKYVKVGDYVNYNATVLDKNGTKVESNKLTYTSSTGSGIEHGNGSMNQTFTTKADIKWRVLDIGTETVTLISEYPITTDSGENFSINGVVGYLYAEQELHEICKIYGYGYGADTSQVTNYGYGGPIDGKLTGQITGSGARSITIEDINKKAGITETDYITLDSNYGSTINPSINIYYPTITTLNGKSNSAGVKNLKYTYYSYNKTEVEDINIQNMLFNKRYWLASRCVNTYSNRCLFRISIVDSDSNFVSASYLCSNDNLLIDERMVSDFSVRPIVTLKSNTIDINTDYEVEGHWNLR